MALEFSVHQSRHRLNRGPRNSLKAKMSETQQVIQLSKRRDIDSESRDSS